MSLTLKEERITISGTVSIGATVTYTGKNTLSPAIVRTYTSNLLNFLRHLDLYVSATISVGHSSQQAISIPQDCMTLQMMQFP